MTPIRRAATGACCNRRRYNKHPSAQDMVAAMPMVPDGVSPAASKVEDRSFLQEASRVWKDPHSVVQIEPPRSGHSFSWSRRSDATISSLHLGLLKP
jgi:hypothetical protein